MFGLDGIWHGHLLSKQAARVKKRASTRGEIQGRKIRSTGQAMGRWPTTGKLCTPKCLATDPCALGIRFVRCDVGAQQAAKIES